MSAHSRRTTCSTESRFRQPIQGIRPPFLPADAGILLPGDQQNRQVFLNLAISFRLIDGHDQPEQRLIAAQGKGHPAQRIRLIGPDVLPIPGEPVQGRFRPVHGFGKPAQHHVVDQF